MYRLSHKTLEPDRARTAMRFAIGSACFGAIGQIMVNESSIIILYAGMLGASRFVSLCTTSLQHLAQCLLYIPVAYWMSRYGRKRLMIPALTIGTGGLLLVSLAPFFGRYAQGALMFGLSVFSISIAIYVVGWFPLLKGIVPPAERGRFFGRLRVSWQITASLFLLGAALVVQRTPSITAFQAIIALGALISFVRVFLLRPIPESVPTRHEPLRVTLTALLRNRTLTGFSAYLFWLYFFAGSTLPVAVLLASRALHIADGFLVLFSAGTMAGSIVGFLLGGRIVDRGGTKLAFLIGHFGFAALNFLLLSVRSASWGSITILLGIGLLYGLVFALASIAVSTESFFLVPPEREDVGLAVCLGLFFAGIGLSRFLSGWVLDSGMLAPEWFFMGHAMTSYHALFLINGCGVLGSGVLLAMIPSLIAPPESAP